MELIEQTFEGGHCSLLLGVGTDCRNNAQDKRVSTVVRFKNRACVQMAAEVTPDREVILKFRGSAELHCLIEAFEFAADALRKQAGIGSDFTLYDEQWDRAFAEYLNEIEATE